MLYPPYIEGTIPSFYGNSLTVPFSMNKAVGAGEVSGFSLKLKTIQNTKYLFTAKTTRMDLNAEYNATFDISSYASKLKVGQHYKVQIAYIDQNGVVGYYSTVGIIKYTSKPKVSIQGLKAGRLNTANYNYIGIYDSSVDTSEKEYKYKFIFSDNEGKVVKETDWEIHNNSNDEKSYLTHDEFLMSLELEKNAVYYIKYKVITNNNLELSSPNYRVSDQLSIDPDTVIALNAKMKQDNGYVLLTMEGEYDNKGNEISLDGAFLISRACEDTEYKEWDEILRFKTKGTLPSNWSYKDFTVEQGKEYIYAFQQYNDFDIYSERINSNIVFADFEDMFLYDGTKQLKISYNPQVSSFKTDILETKTDTIGSKYPFFFRNGSVEYKEFSLNGLISYLSDEEHLFMTDAEMGLSPKVENMTRNTTVLDGFTPDDQYYYKKGLEGVNVYNLKQSYADDKENRQILDSTRYRTTQLTSFNMSAERTFKLKVLEWLNNSEPKLFRSPGEGNYIVRLMNVSLSPEDTLSRMLHSFSCTAYEIDEYSYENLNTYGFISSDSPESKQLKFKTLMLKDYLDKELIDNDYAVTIRFENMTPGDKIILNTDTPDEGEAGTSIVIGATGNYLIDTGTKIFKARLDAETASRYTKQSLNSPMVTYSYYDSTTSKFNEITSMTFESVPARQFIGEDLDVMSKLNNIKTTLITFYYLHFMKRDTLDLELPDGQEPTYQNLKAVVDENKVSDFFLYKFVVPAFEGNVKKYEEAEVKNALELQYYRLRYYVKDAEGNFVRAAGDYNSNTTYYTLNENNILYFDSRINKILISEENYNYLKQYLNAEILKKYYDLYETTFRVDNNSADLKDTGEFSITEPSNFNTIEIGSGVVLEAGYSQRIINYSIETENDNAASLKAELDEILEDIAEQFGQDENAELEKLYKNYTEKYNKYIELITRLKKEEE